MLASTLIPQPMSMTNARFEEHQHAVAWSFHDGDLETSCRAASVLSHVMKDNNQCKEKLDEMQKSFLFSCEKPAQPRKPLTRSNTNSMTQLEDPQFENEATDVNRNDDHPMLASMFDSQFVKFIKKLEAGIRDGIVRVYSQTKSNVSVVPAGLEQRKDENDRDYIKRFKIFTEKQCSEIQVNLHYCFVY
ncbi:golgin candidate 6 isoform X1 [Tanacetum coccineum]